MKKLSIKNLSLLLVLLLIISLISLGCAGDNNNNNTNPDQTPIEGEGGGDIEDGNETEDENQEQTIEGTFTGWIDSNSFEVISNNVPYAIRISEDVVMPDDTLDGRTVRITFVTNEHGQNIIREIEVIE